MKTKIKVHMQQEDNPRSRRRVEIDAYKNNADESLSVHRSLNDKKKSWCVTHDATGAIAAEFPTKKEALACSADIARFFPADVTSITKLMKEMPRSTQREIRAIIADHQTRKARKAS